MVAELGAHWHRQLAFFSVVGACLKRINHVKHCEIAQFAAVSFVETAVDGGVGH